MNTLLCKHATMPFPPPPPLPSTFPFSSRFLCREATFLNHAKEYDSKGTGAQEDTLYIGCRSHTVIQCSVFQHAARPEACHVFAALCLACLTHSVLIHAVITLFVMRPHVMPYADPPSIEDTLPSKVQERLCRAAARMHRGLIVVRRCVLSANRDGLVQFDCDLIVPHRLLVFCT